MRRTTWAVLLGVTIPFAGVHCFNVDGLTGGHQSGDISWDGGSLVDAQANSASVGNATGPGSPGNSGSSSTTTDGSTEAGPAAPDSGNPVDAAVVDSGRGPVPIYNPGVGLAGCGGGGDCPSGYWCVTMDLSGGPNGNCVPIASNCPTNDCTCYPTNLCSPGTCSSQGSANSVTFNCN